MRGLALVYLLAACGQGAPEPAAKVIGITAANAAPAVDAALDPTVAQRCDEPCLFLTDTPLDQLGEKFQASCGRPLVPNNADCGVLDYQRNCIYATHGLRFRKPKWKAFTTKPWYRMRPEFRSRELTTLERENVHELRLRARACRHNDVHVSTADYTRIQTWFAGYAKGVPVLPAVVMSSEDRVRPDELGATLATLALRLEKDTWMAYHDPEPSVAMALSGAKLRDVIADFSGRDRDCEDDCGGPFLHFVFDAKDQLVALVLTDH